MRTTTTNVLVVLLGLLAPLAAADPAETIIGTWKPDPVQMKAKIELMKQGQDDNPMSGIAVAMMEQMIGGMKMTITEETMTMEMTMPAMGEGAEPKTQTQTVNYTVASVDGQTISLEVDNEGKKEPGTITVTDADHIIMVGDKGDDQAIPMVRVGADGAQVK